MNIERFIRDLPDQYYSWSSLAAFPRDPRRFIDVLENVQHMTSPATLQLINFAVACMDAGEVYLEVGAWRGATTIGALIGNTARGYAIDNDSMDDHDKDDRKSADVWKENIKKFNLGRRATYINASAPEVFERKDLLGGSPAGVFLFDGDKRTPDVAYKALMGAVPFLSPRAVILVDDANTPQIREAAFWFCHHYRTYACKMLDLPTPGNCWPVFWNGLIVIGWGVSLQKETVEG